MSKQLDEYLEEVTTQLGSLPAERREEELREMRQHLHEAVAVRREQGLSEESAVAAALMQFGTPQEAAESVIWAWRDHVRKVWTRFSVRYLALWGIASIFPITQMFWLMLHSHNGSQHNGNNLSIFVIGLYVFNIFMPLLMVLLLYLPRKYQPAWVYRCLINGPVAKIR